MSTDRHFYMQQCRFATLLRHFTLPGGLKARNQIDGASKGMPMVLIFFARRAVIRTSAKCTLTCSFVRFLGTVREWHASEVITDRKSRFQARHVPIADELEIPAILEQLLEDHKNIARSASHPHIIAWRTGKPVEVLATPERKLPSKTKRKTSMPPKTTLPIKYTDIKQGFKDNGEKGAGSKILLQVLEHQDLVNILVIVTRWYGGCPIGPLRFRHIVNASLESLRKR